MIRLILFISLITVGLLFDIYFFFFLRNKKENLYKNVNIIREKIWDIDDIMSIVIWVSLAYAVVIMLQVYGYGDDDMVRLSIKNPFMLIYVTVILPFMEFIAVFLLFKRHKLSLKDAFGIDKQKISYHFWIGIVLGIAAIPFVEVSKIIYRNLITKITTLTLQPMVSVMANHDVSVFIRLHVILVGVIISPVIEEVIFRGIVLPVFLKYTGLWQAIIYHSLIFAIFHWHLPALVPLFIMSIVFSLGYVYTGSIITSIGIHALFNGLTTLLLLTR